MKIAGVIFDMDGLLIDSERFSMDMCIKILEKLNIQYTKEDYVKTIGLNHRDCTKLMLEHLHGDQTKVDLIYQLYDERMIQAYQNGEIPLKKGAERIIRYLLEHHIPMALATSSPFARVQDAFSNSVFGGVPFAKVITGQEVTNGKPHPEIFLKAAELIGQDITKCIVLEDSYNGINAAYRAKAITVMVPDLLEPIDEIRAKCNYVVKDLDEALELIREE